MKVLGKKRTLLSLIFSISSTLYAQPNCFLVGPAFAVGSIKISNYSFYRSCVVGADGKPSTSFSTMSDVKASEKSVGILMDIYKKHTRFSMDLMFPLKSYSNFFNMNLAFGGYIKGKVGILGGLSVYSNPLAFLAQPTDPLCTKLDLAADYSTSGYYYSTAALKTSAGVNALITYAVKDNFVLRVDYGLYAGDIKNKKVVVPEGYDWGKPGKSRKLEFGAVWQFSDNFGLAAKYVMWNTVGNYTADVSYQENGPTGITTQTTQINLIPERQIKSNVFTICIMIPLGGAEAQSGTIEVVK